MLCRYKVFASFWWQLLNSLFYTPIHCWCSGFWSWIQTNASVFLAVDYPYKKEVPQTGDLWPMHVGDRFSTHSTGAQWVHCSQYAIVQREQVRTSVDHHLVILFLLLIFKKRITVWRAVKPVELMHEVSQTEVHPLSEADKLGRSLVRVCMLHLT